MTLTQILLGSGAILTAAVSVVWFWMASRSSRTDKSTDTDAGDHDRTGLEADKLHDQELKQKIKDTAKGNVKEAANYDVEHIFNTEFREELRNRGRL